LIGREQEVREVVEHLSASRLVTLVGAGGVGKTRLAIEIARTVTDTTGEFADGALFVPLAALSDPALLPALLAAALGLREEAAPDPELLQEALVGWLSTHPSLLVLDNCEHLVEAVAELTHALLLRCPKLRILATSRQRLGLMGEVVCRVPSLPTPDPERLRLKENEQEQDRESYIRQYPAAQLFLERAAMAQPGFRLAGPEEALALAEVCRRLDGIPLAIELAAARIGLLSVTQIASRLSDRFQLLTGGNRAVLPRHQTLKALIDWSYDQLTQEEQGLLRRLSVFVGGWTLEAAEAVGGDLDLLASLADKSLVLAEKQAQGAGVRYRMLETVREYAREKLRESGQEAAARNQHLAYCLKLAETVAPDLRGVDPLASLSLVESDIGNVRAALAWTQSEAAAPADAPLRLAAALWPFWEVRGYHAEGREHLRAALNWPGSADAADTPERARAEAQALLGAATLAFVQADLKATLDFGRQSLARFRRRNEPRSLAEALILCGHACLESGEVLEAASLLQEALDNCRRCDWVRGSALALTHLGLVAMQQQEAPDQARSLLDEGLREAEAAGHAPTLALALHNRGLLEGGNYSSTVALLEKSLEIWRQLGHGHKASLTLRHLGWTARRQGDLARARTYFIEAVAVCREQGNRFHLAFVLLELGSVHYEQGDYEPARQSYTESLELFIQTGDERGINGARMNLGSTLFHLGEYARSRELHRKSLAFYQAAGSADGIAWSLERLAVVEAARAGAHQAESSKAARLLGAASVAREAWGKPLDRWDREDWDRAVAAVRATLGEAAFDALYAAGRSLSRDQMLALALDGAS
jgi:non-specific serine/threonine protein kinase